MHNSAVCSTKPFLPLHPRGRSLWHERPIFLPLGRTWQPDAANERVREEDGPRGTLLLPPLQPELSAWASSLAGLRRPTAASHVKGRDGGAVRASWGAPKQGGVKEPDQSLHPGVGTWPPRWGARRCEETARAEAGTGLGSSPGLEAPSSAQRERPAPPAAGAGVCRKEARGMFAQG